MGIDVTKMRERRDDSRGAVAVEFALLLPFLLALLVGMLDFALAFNAQIQVSQAAQAGARAASVGLASGVVTARAQGASPVLGLTASKVSVDATCPTPADASATATVTVSYPFRFPIPLPGVASTITLRQRAVTPCTPTS
jgi:Flp pilus assembly protein TadG